MGRFVREKGVLDLLKALPLLPPEARDRLCLLFAGAGPLSATLLAAEKAWPSTVRVVPFAPYETVHALHQAADLFVLPSRPAATWEEQFGYVLVEAMACGIPVISTRSGSIPDVVESAGTLVSPGHPEEIAAALQLWILDPDERKVWGEKALARARACFDAEMTASKIESLYKELSS
jgi:glycosyltransferase involved in cell wall biosynthesis